MFKEYGVLNMYTFKFNEYPYNIRVNKKYKTYNNLLKTLKNEYIDLKIEKDLSFKLYNDKNNKFLAYGSIHHTNIILYHFCEKYNFWFKNYFQQWDLTDSTLMKEEKVTIDHLNKREKIIEHFTLELKNHLNIDGTIDSQIHSNFKDKFLPLMLEEYNNYYEK